MRSGRHLLCRQILGYHVRVALETTEEENLASIRDSVRAAKAEGREVLLDCEHFFDGYKANPAYALACAKAAYDEGARWVVLCDTNGGTLPHEVEKSSARFASNPRRSCRHPCPQRHRAGGGELVCRVRAGARQIQGTLNGLGERCGNANLVSIIPTLKLKSEYAEKFDIGVSDDALGHIGRVSHGLDDMLNRAADRHAPYVGESAFATKAGIHASAIVKDPATYEHVAPERVGNKRRLLVSDQSGRSNLLAELDRIGLAVDKDDPRLARLLDEVKEREAIGYAYEAADASFELLARRLLGKVPRYFDVEKFDVSVEHRINAKGERVTVSMAVVKVRVGDDLLISAAEGNGPVNALDRRAAQGPRQIPKLHHRAGIDGLPCAYPQRRHGSRHARADRERGRNRRSLDDDRGVVEHHRRVVPGADGFDRLQAREVRRAGLIELPSPARGEEQRAGDSR